MKKLIRSFSLVCVAAMTAFVVSVMPCSVTETPEETETTTESTAEIQPLHDGYYEG